MIRKLLHAGILLFISLGVIAQIKLADHVYYTDEDREIFDKYLATIQTKKNLPVDELIIETGKFFLGTPYVASTLEKEPEGLVINLRELDCTTFMETVLALVHTVKKDNPSFENYCHNLQYIRYRNGVVNDYADRIHYATDWVYENARKGIVKDINKEIGGVPLILNLNFMSTHPDSYKQTKGNPELTQKIADTEKAINTRSYFYIPKTDLDAHSDQFKSGDVVGFTTSIKGLDLSHVGFIFRDGNTLTFIHASSLAKKVIINPDPLKVYTEKVKSCTGVLIARPQRVH